MTKFKEQPPAPFPELGHSSDYIIGEFEKIFKQIL
jgi:hypothetical protein